MTFINVGDTVKLKEELLRYAANNRWIGVRGKVNCISGSYAYVSWKATWKMEDEVEEPIDFLEKVYE